MEPLEWIALIGGVLSLLGVSVDAWQTHKANKEQKEHDKAMAALNHRYREQEAASSFEREATFNQFASDETKMREAGLSPALMYGQYSGNSTPQISSVGSSQGAGNVGRHVSASDFLGKLDPANYMESTIQRMNAQTMRDKTKSDIALQNQLLLESASKTAENQRNTAFKKSLETMIFNQEVQALQRLQRENANLEFDLQLKRDTRSIEIEKRQLENKELQKKVDLLSEQIKTEPVARAQLAKSMKLIDQQASYYGKNTEMLDENLKGSQLERIMKEFGLNARTINPMMRNWDALSLPYQTQMRAAKLALEKCGFSEFEATNAVIYYMATDRKDVTPSFINGMSRFLSGNK